MHHPFWIGDRVYLRGLERRDLDSNYFQWFNDQDVTRHMYHGTFPNTASDMEAFYNEVTAGHRHVVFAIMAIEGDVHIGNVGIHRIDWQKSQGEYGIILGEKSYWGKGLGLEATRLILDYIFLRVGLRRIWLGVHEQNVRAIRSYEKSGFVHEGRLRKEFYTEGQWYDRIIMGLLKDEYLSARMSQDQR